jgi:putative methyltransferase (TIGR04325 family)
MNTINSTTFKMNRFKSLLKRIFPNAAIRFLFGLFYGWHGNYTSWALAKSTCTGYDSNNILEKVKESTLKVKNGEAAFERDSVAFDKMEYSYPFLSALMWVAAQKGGKLNVLDFGGALGSSYFQYNKFLDAIKGYKWCVVEQQNFVNEGQLTFKNETLNFYHSIDECVSENKIDVVILSSVLQYLKSPYELLETIYLKNIDFVLIDRTAFFEKPDRITIQKVNPSIYKASYPCWFFNKQKFLDFMQTKYDILLTFNSKDWSNVKSEFLGFLFKRK